MSDIIISNQIAKVQTNKKLIAMLDKLSYAGTAHYAQIHAKGEKNGQGRKNTSLIGIMLQDYSKGTGQNNIITQFNLAPEQVQFLLSRVTAGFQDYDWTQDKIFGEPDQNGLSIAQRIQISRHGFKQDGSVSNNPWFIAITNGFGVRVQNNIGGYYMQRGSFKQDKYAFINLTDMDMFTLLKRVDSYITAWENVMAMDHLLKDRAAYESYVEEQRHQGQQNNVYNNGQQYQQSSQYQQPYQGQYQEPQQFQGDYPQPPVMPQQEIYQPAQQYPQYPQQEMQYQQQIYQEQPDQYQTAGNGISSYNPVL